MRVEVTTQGIVPARDRLANIAKRSVDAKPVFSLIADELVAREKSRFDGGAGWAPLKAATIARKGNSRVLWATGALASSLTERRGPGQKLRIARTSLTFGTKVFYAHFHQTGTKGKDGTQRMVARPPTHLTEAEVVGFTRRISAYLAGGEL